MDKNLFAKRLVEQRERAGYKTQSDFAKAYNERYPQKHRDEANGNLSKYAGILGTIKHYENPDYIRSMPTAEKVSNICDILGCDIDYLLGRIDEQTHDLDFVCKYTGLSAKAVSRITEIKPGGYVAHAFGMEKEFDLFITLYGFDLAFHLSQLKHATEKARAAAASIRGDTREESFDFVENTKRELILQVFEFTEFFRRIQDTIFGTSALIENLDKIQHTIYGDKTKEAPDNGK